MSNIPSHKREGDQLTAEEWNNAARIINELDAKAYVKPQQGIPKNDLQEDVQNSLSKADDAYQKPQDGIPFTDLNNTIQEDLVNARTALQPSDIEEIKAVIPLSASTSNKLATITDVITDYNELTTKPQINSVTLSGNKSASDLGLATAAQGVKADTAYQRPLSGIPESDLSSDVQQALQKHFKGWFASTSQLPSNPVVGDYAYVKENDTTYIYRCSTNGEWPSTSTEEKEPADVTFASSEEVNETYIDSTHLVNPSEGALPTAADVMQLKAKLEGVTASEVKVNAVVGTNVTTGAYVSGETGLLVTPSSSASSYAYFELAIPQGTKSIRFAAGTRTSAGKIGYSIGYYNEGVYVPTRMFYFDVAETTPPTGIVEKVIEVLDGETTFMATVASVGTYSSITLESFYCYLQSGKTIIERVDEVSKANKTESYCVFEYIQGLFLSNQGVVSTASSSGINAYQIPYTKVRKGDVIHLKAIPRIMSVAQSSAAELRVGFSESIPSNGITVTNFHIYNPGAKVSTRTIVDELIEVTEDGYFYAYYPIAYRIHVYDINCSTIISSKKDDTIGVSQGRIYNGYPDGDKKYVTSDFIKGGSYFDLVCRDGYKINSVHLYNDSGELICPNFIGESNHTDLRYRDRKGWGSILPPHIMARVTFVKNSNGCIADEDCLVEDRPIKSLTYLTNDNNFIKDIPASVEAAYPFVQYRAKTLVYLLSHYLISKENVGGGTYGLTTLNDYCNLFDRIYCGVSYSDIRDIPTLVGQDVSIYTYLTALAHKYSVVYTETRGSSGSVSSMYGRTYKTSGAHSLQYYEMACNMFWGYCMGRYAMSLTSYVVSNGYTKVFTGSASPLGNISDSVQALDTLLKKGHVAFVLDVIKKDNEVKYIVVSESTTPFTRITVYPKADFDSYYMSNVGSVSSPDYYNVWRKNTAIDANTYYQPFDSDNAEYVEHYLEDYPYIGSPKECMLYVGDRASLIIDWPVYVNVNRGYGKYTKINLYKDDNLIQEIPISSLTKIANDPDGEDWVSVNLTSYIDGYGKYKAVVSNADGSVTSNETVWEMIDISLSVTPTIATFSVDGGKPYIIQEEEKNTGFLKYNCDLLAPTDTTHDISLFTHGSKIALYAMGDYGVVKKVVDRATN